MRELVSATNFPLPICIRAICKPVCYIRAGGEIKRKNEEGERAPSLFLRLVIGIISLPALNLVAEAAESRLSPSTVIKRGVGWVINEMPRSLQEQLM